MNNPHHPDATHAAAVTSGICDALGKATGYNFTHNGEHYATSSMNLTTAKAIASALNGHLHCKPAIAVTENAGANSKLMPKDQRGVITIAASVAEAAGFTEALHANAQDIKHTSLNLIARATSPSYDGRG